MVVLDECHGPDFALYNADAVELLPGLPDKSVDLSIFSPPFSSLYTYSASERDMGNCRDDAEFIKHYSFMLRELLRITRPGRLCVVHCKDLVDYKGSAGKAGLRDFPGEIIRAHEAAGWKYHSRTTIWKSPVVEMQRTKAHGLLYKQLRTDSTFSRMGLPDYLLWFRRWADDGEEVSPVTQTEASFPLDQWQEWASPVWMTVDQTDVLNVQQARADKDEKHMCPLQLDVIERVVRLHSNPGDTVFSPFAGIGSEGYGALKCGRKFVGVELKPEYWRWAIKNLAAARSQSSFSFLPAATAAPADPIAPSDSVSPPHSVSGGDLRRAGEDTSPVVTEQSEPKGIQETLTPGAGGQAAVSIDLAVSDGAVDVPEASGKRTEDTAGVLDLAAAGEKSTAGEAGAAALATQCASGVEGTTGARAHVSRTAAAEPLEKLEVTHALASDPPREGPTTITAGRDVPGPASQLPSATASTEANHEVVQRERPSVATAALGSAVPAHRAAAAPKRLSILTVNADGTETPLEVAP